MIIAVENVTQIEAIVAWWLRKNDLHIDAVKFVFTDVYESHPYTEAIRLFTYYFSSGKHPIPFYLGLGFCFCRVPFKPVEERTVKESLTYDDFLDLFD